MGLDEDKNKDEDQPKLPAPDRLDDELSDDQEKTSNSSNVGRATTTSVSETLEHLRNQIGGQQLTVAPTITLKILGVDTPITFHDRYEIILGRVNPSTNERPDVDLSGLPVNVVGVSRKHIKLAHSKGKWYAEDLGSRNGSWINGKLMTAFQRYSLTDGDQIRAGNVIFIVMMGAIEHPPSRPPRISQASSVSFALATASITDGQVGLTPYFISETLMPYVQAIIDMMQYVDRAKSRTYREISVVSFKLGQTVITIQLSHTNEILDFLRNEKVLMAPISRGSLKTGKSKSLSTGDVDELVDDLLERFSNEHLKTLPPDQLKNYQWSLAKSLRVCIESDMWFTV